jgi:hypothetical protein
MMSLQDVTYSNDLIGTSSSGASLIPYAKRWESQGHEDANILFGAPKLHEPIGAIEQFDAYLRLRSGAISLLYADMTTRLRPWRNTLRLLRQTAPIASYIITTEPQKLVETSTWWDTPQIFWSEGFTTVNMEPEESHKQIIQYWQRHEILDRFAVLAQREDDWDGYESKKPTQPTLAHAQHLMEELLDSVISAGHLWFTPFISSDEDGNVTAEWYEEERQLHIQIGENETEYIQVWGTNIDTEMHVDFLSIDNYLTLWEWLIDG